MKKPVIQNKYVFKNHQTELNTIFINELALALAFACGNVGRGNSWEPPMDPVVFF